jgi:FkbM family methyltransferase
MSIPIVSQGEREVDQAFSNASFRAWSKVPSSTSARGAGRPDFLSMSAHFRSFGWRVIAIEPNPVFCDAYRAAGLEVLQYACSDHDEDDAEFELVDSHGHVYEGGAVSFESFSSLAVKPAYRALKPDLDVTRITVQVRRLDTILAEHAPELQRLDVVSVDVEGWELEVLDGLSFERYRPAVVIVENLFNEASYRRAMGGRGYALWRRRAPNDVYVRSSGLSRGERAAALLRRCWVPLELPRLRRALRRRALRTLGRR